MPREGYVSVSITVEAKEILESLRDELGVRSYSDAIKTMYEFYNDLLDLLKKYDGRFKRFRT
jgi:predicted CopG family antitoxin